MALTLGRQLPWAGGVGSPVALWNPTLLTPRSFWCKTRRWNRWRRFVSGWRVGVSHCGDFIFSSTFIQSSRAENQNTPPLSCCLLFLPLECCLSLKERADRPPVTLSSPSAFLALHCVHPRSSGPTWQEPGFPSQELGRTFSLLSSFSPKASLPCALPCFKRLSDGVMCREGVYPWVCGSQHGPTRRGGTRVQVHWPVVHVEWLRAWFVEWLCYRPALSSGGLPSALHSGRRVAVCQRGCPMRLLHKQSGWASECVCNCHLDSHSCDLPVPVVWVYV